MLSGILVSPNWPIKVNKNFGQVSWSTAMLEHLSASCVRDTKMVRTAETTIQNNNWHPHTPFCLAIVQLDRVRGHAICHLLLDRSRDQCHTRHNKYLDSKLRVMPVVPVEPKIL
jgi:hypothetical protein